MLNRESCEKATTQLRIRTGVDASDEQLIATIHLMNRHGADQNQALDASSRSGNDCGVDAWFWDNHDSRLYIYQSKLSDSRSMVVKGLADLVRASRWVESVVVEGALERSPADNHSLFNLYTTLGGIRASLRHVTFVLLSVFSAGAIEDGDEYQQASAAIVKSPLNQWLSERSGSVDLRVESYNLERRLPAGVKVYSIGRLPETRIPLRPNAHLDLAYIPLHSLVELYRQRGDVLFDKNVRLSLINTKEGRERLVHPMQRTLADIANGRISPSLFTFYHVGITIAATTAGQNAESIALEAPSIINGCQTITIASDFLAGLEKAKDEAGIDAFKQVKVIAKVVVGTTADELKEITNSNNRQNPIDNWQLFSNESIHIELEAMLKERGVFYERQKGKFDSVIKRTDSARFYHATNGSYIRLIDLAQAATLSMGLITWAAKPSEVFLNKENHDKIFGSAGGWSPDDMIFVSNLLKAMKRGLNKYLELPVHINSIAPAIFRKPVVRAHAYRLTMMHFFQASQRQEARRAASKNLHKIASPKLVDEVQVFYQKIVTRTKEWYSRASSDMTAEVSRKALDQFFATLAIETGVDLEGPRPF